MGTVTKQGVASWGVTSDGSVVDGIVTHIDKDDESIMAPEYNELGQIVKQTLYDLHKTLSVTIEVAVGTEPPSAKDSVTIAGVTAYVLRTRTVEDNKAYRHIEVTVEAYKNCSAVTVADGSGI